MSTDPMGSSSPPDAADEPLLDDEATTEGPSARVRRFARRLMSRQELADDTKDLLYAVLSTSDKAKTEAVRMVAREVRNYLSELRLKEDLMDLARSHSLEISISLKPLVDGGDGGAGEGETGVTGGGKKTSSTSSSAADGEAPVGGNVG